MRFVLPAVLSLLALSTCILGKDDSAVGDRKVQIEGESVYFLGGKIPIKVKVTVTKDDSVHFGPHLLPDMGQVELVYPSGKIIAPSVAEQKGWKRVEGGDLAGAVLHLLHEKGGKTIYGIDLADHFVFKEAGKYTVRWYSMEVPESQKEDDKIVIWAPGMKKVPIVSFSFEVRKVIEGDKQQIQRAVYFPHSFHSAPKYGLLNLTISLGKYKGVDGKQKSVIAVGPFKPARPDRNSQILSELLGGEKAHNYIKVPVGTIVKRAELDFKGVLWIHAICGEKQCVLILDGFTRTHMTALPWGKGSVALLVGRIDGRYQQCVSATDGKHAISTLSVSRELIISAPEGERVKKTEPQTGVPVEPDEKKDGEK